MKDTQICLKLTQILPKAASQMETQKLQKWLSLHSMALQVCGFGMLTKWRKCGKKRKEIRHNSHICFLDVAREKHRSELYSAAILNAKERERRGGHFVFWCFVLACSDSGVQALFVCDEFISKVVKFTALS